MSAEEPLESQSPVGREFGSPDYERLAILDAAAKTAKGQTSITSGATSIQALKGILRKPAKPVTLEDMERAIAAPKMRT